MKFLGGGKFPLPFPIDETLQLCRGMRGGGGGGGAGVTPLPYPVYSMFMFGGEELRSSTPAGPSTQAPILK